MLQPGRSFAPDGYRFGFNGQEKTDEISGPGNHNTAMFWEYDTRLGRRWNLDPKPHPSFSSYSVLGNNPIINTDPFGDTTSYYNIHNGDFLGTINDAGKFNRVKVAEFAYSSAMEQACADNVDLTNQTSADNFVSSFNNKIAGMDRSSGTNFISFETGNYQIDFTDGKIVDADDMTGKTINKDKNAEFGITGTMKLNSIFDDGSTLTTNSYDFTSGPYGNGPTPNHNYVSSVFTPNAIDEGMRLNSGANGWKLRLPNFNGRTSMCLHPDVNSIGTKGCIGIRILTSDQPLIKLGNFLDNYINVQHKTINVNFQIPNNPNYGNDGKASDEEQ